MAGIILIAPVIIGIVTSPILQYTISRYEDNVMTTKCIIAALCCGGIYAYPPGSAETGDNWISAMILLYILTMMVITILYDILKIVIYWLISLT